jgi:hypothetical protein
MNNPLYCTMDFHSLHHLVPNTLLFPQGCRCRSQFQASCTHRSGNLCQGKLSITAQLVTDRQSPVTNTVTKPLLLTPYTLNPPKHTSQIWTEPDKSHMSHIKHCSKSPNAANTTTAQSHQVHPNRSTHECHCQAPFFWVAFLNSWQQAPHNLGCRFDTLAAHTVRLSSNLCC